MKPQNACEVHRIAKLVNLYAWRCVDCGQTEYADDGHWTGLPEFGRYVVLKEVETL